jgi:hypothetical protein
MRGLVLFLIFPEAATKRFVRRLFKAGQQDKLLQPVVIGTEIKQKLKDGGYLP